jgi:hypothetical protein
MLIKNIDTTGIRYCQGQAEPRIASNYNVTREEQNNA